MSKTQVIQKLLRVMAYLSTRCDEEPSKGYADGHWSAGFVIGKAYNDIIHTL